MIAREIRQRSDDELLRLEASLVEELFQYRMQNAAGQPDMGRIRKTRRDLARVKTVMHERGLASRAPAGGAVAEQEPEAEE
jgi:large subunit ribosomal protein L29